MWVLIVIALQVAVRVGVAPPSAPLTRAAQVAIAPVHTAFEDARRSAANLPPPKNSSERLLRLAPLDQAGRVALAELNLAGLSAEDRQNATSVAWSEIFAQDQNNQHELLELIPPEGWFFKTSYSDNVRIAAFLILQHANPDIWSKVLPVFEAHLADGEIEGSQYALLFDRSAVMRGQPQRYGTQLRCQGGKLTLPLTEDAATLDARRRSVGLKKSEAEYIVMVEAENGKCP